MIGFIFEGGRRAEGGGSSLVKSLKTLGRKARRKGGSSLVKSLISLRAEAEGKPPSKLGVAASGGGPRFLSTRSSKMATKIFMGQSYRCIGVEPHTRADGSASSLAVWESACADCGKLFSFKTPDLASKFSPNRRCEKHRRRGVKVEGSL